MTPGHTDGIPCADPAGRRGVRRWHPGAGSVRFPARRAGVFLLLAACAPRSLPPPAPGPPRPPPPATVPDDARSRFLTAAVAERRGDLDRAEADLRWVVRLDRTDPWAWLHLGSFLERRHRTDEAIAAYRRALERDPTLPATNLALGTALVRSGAPDDALPFLERAARDGGPRALHLYARALGLTGRPDAAEAVFDRWLALPATSAEALDRARLAYELGRFDDAVDDLVSRVRWTSAPPSAAALLLEASGRSCRLGSAWLWVREEGIADHPDPRWRRIGQTIEDRAAHPPPACRTPAPALPDAISCGDLPAARAAWEAAPLDDDAFAAFARAASACGTPDATALVAHIRRHREGP